MSDELPDGWAQTTLGELLREPLRNGHSARASSDGSGIRTLSLSAVTYGDFSEKNTKLTVAEPSKVSDLWLEPGDLLIERANTPELVGTTRLYRGPRNFAIFPDLVIRARLLPAACPSLIELMLQSAEVRKYFTERAQGSSQSMPKIDQGAVLDVPIALPPIAEQIRLVAKVETLMTEVSATRARLARVPIILKRFRQSVLAAACSGDLTKDWRSESPPDAPASTLLTLLPDLHHRENKIGIESLEVPEGWVMAPLGRLVDLVDPNPSHRYPTYDKGTIPLLATREFFGLDGWAVEAAPLVPASVYAEQNKTCRFSQDDIIFARKGRLGLPRRPPRLPAYTFSHTIFVIKTKPPVMSSYVLWMLRQQSVVDWLLQKMNSNEGVPTLGKSVMESLPVQLPPLREQAEIVRRIEALFALADTIERRVVAAIARTDKVPQAILAKAFRGELVPTEAELARAEGRDYESASALLERIRKEREAASPTAGRGRKKAAREKAPAQEKRAGQGDKLA